MGLQKIETLLKEGQLSKKSSISGTMWLPAVQHNVHLYNPTMWDHAKNLSSQGLKWVNNNRWKTGGMLGGGMLAGHMMTPSNTNPSIYKPPAYQQPR